MELPCGATAELGILRIAEPAVYTLLHIAGRANNLHFRLITVSHISNMARFCTLQEAVDEEILKNPAQTKAKMMLISMATVPS